MSNQLPADLEDGCATVKSKFKNKFYFGDIVSPPKRSQLINTYSLTSEDQFFIAACVVYDGDEGIYHKANAALILGYRAIDAWNVSYIDNAIIAILLVVKKLKLIPNDDSTLQVKFNNNHVRISLALMLAQLSIASENEKLFVGSLIDSLDVVKNNKGIYLKHSYYSLNLIFNFIASYLDNSFIEPVKKLSIKLSQLSYSYHDDQDKWSRYKEFSLSVHNLSILVKYQEDQEGLHENLFNCSLRCSHREQLYRSYCDFTGSYNIALEEVVSNLADDFTSTDNNKLNLLVQENNNQETSNKQAKNLEILKTLGSEVNTLYQDEGADILREVALSFERSGDISTALTIMQKALQVRPSGPFIKKKVTEYLQKLEAQ